MAYCGGFPHSLFVLLSNFIDSVSKLPFTGSAVTLHCGKAHVQSQWEMANFDPNDIKIPEIFQI